jgi:hypothetical protein
VTAVRLARTVGLILATVILAVSGAYVIIDLARWEWNRAIVSGLVCIAALVIVVAMVLTRQLRRLEERVEALADRQRSEVVLPGTGLSGIAVHGALRDATAEAASARFRWLETPPDRLGVFVPVLLGAGVIVSLLTYLIERIAGAVASVTVDRATVRALEPDLPLGTGLVDPTVVRPSGEPAHHPVLLGAVAVVSVLVSLLAVEGLRQLTQTRPDEITSMGATTIVIGIEQRRTEDPETVIASALWGVCRSRLPGGITVLSVATTGPGEASITIDRALGRTGRTRIVGCLEDHTMDLVRADVREVTVVPAGT